MQELVRAAHLSPFHLSRVFRRTVGVPPHAYQTQLRLAHARTLLAQGLDVARVAQETGFFDQSHFSQQFQRYFFVKPGSYRRTAGYFPAIALTAATTRTTQPAPAAEAPDDAPWAALLVGRPLPSVHTAGPARAEKSR